MMGRSSTLVGARESADKLQEEFDRAVKALQIEIGRSSGQAGKQ
jgi:hypothetical protein